MYTIAFILVGCFVFGFGLISKRLVQSPLTPPLVFVFLGVVFGPWGLDWLQLNIEDGAMHVLAELTLIVVLFGDAARIDLSALRQELALPVHAAWLDADQIVQLRPGNGGPQLAADLTL